jgi:glycosyltransferase involved in cell wall biosynthesis
LTFSISIPIHDHAEYLETALESIRCQAVDVQLAVLDASPDDRAQNVLAPYRDMVHFAYHHSDAGQAAAIQEGWNNTSGDIVAWLNADDYYFPQALAKVRQIFAERSDVDVVYGHAVHVSTDGGFEMYFPAISEDPALLRRGCVICQPACFLRRETLQRVGELNGALHYAMDWEFWLRLLDAGCNFYLLDEVLAAVRIHPGMKTLSGAKRRYREIGDILREHSGWLHRNASLLGFFHYDLANRNRSVLDDVFFSGLNGLSKLYELLKRPKKIRIRGLECWTNKVTKACEVCLPRYSRQPPTEVVIFTDHPLELSVQLNEIRLEPQSSAAVTTVFQGRRFKAHTYRAAVPPASSNFLCFQLNSQHGPWRLLRLEVT